MKYYVPKYYLGKLEKLVKALQKKTNVKFEYDENDAKIEKFVDHSTPEYKEYRYLAIGVELEIDYKVGDYELVAELEHTGNGNIIRQINFEIEVPKTYRSVPCQCEHCKTNRKRNNTFLLVDKQHNFKQVGKNCLNEYTGIDTLSIINKVSALGFLLQEDMLELDDEFKQWLTHSAPSYEPIDYMANLFYQIILKNGYSKVSPFEDLNNLQYCDELQPKVEEILNVVNTDWYNDDNDYCYNVKIVLGLEYVEPKHWKILLSYINSAMLYLQKQEQKKLELQGLTNEYLGNVGDRIEFEVKAIKLLYTRYTNYSYRGEENYVYRILTTTNNVVIWTTQLSLIKNSAPDCFMCQQKPFTKIKATIKDLKEYKGEKQTIITRGKCNQVELPKRKVKEIEYTKCNKDKCYVKERIDFDRVFGDF